MTQYWDRAGKPLHVIAWAHLYNHDSYRRVARNIVASRENTTDVLDVSTIWWGYDTELALADGAPGWPDRGTRYETAVLRGPRQHPTIITSWRGVTEADARRLHDEAVAWACDRVTSPVVVRIPVVPARPRYGWNAPWQRRSGPCQVCRRKISLRNDGTTVAHGRHSGRQHPACPGTHLPAGLPPSG
jgi:hypothetical protein